MSDISPTTSSTGPTATLPAGDTASASNADSSASLSSLNGVNASTFLQLLVSELQNQNPDDPSDPTEFLTQTADFEEVEELSNLQTSMTNVVTAQQNSSATSMLGMQVTGTSDEGESVSGTVTGVQLTSNGPVLEVGSSSIPYSSLSEVSQPSSTGTSTSSTTN